MSMCRQQDGTDKKVEARFVGTKAAPSTADSSHHGRQRLELEGEINDPTCRSTRT